MHNFKILDGAMGSELIQRGLILPKHIWSGIANLNNPQLISQIHKEYISSGADYITANTFRTTPRSYKKYFNNLTPSDKITNHAKKSLLQAVKLAKYSAAGYKTQIIGSIAPLEDCYLPDNFPGYEIAKKEFYQIGKWLSISEVDIILFETMNSIIETEAGISATIKFNKPIWVSFVLMDGDHLLSGEKLIDALQVLTQYKINTVLINCSSIEITKSAVNNIVDNCNLKWGIYPNLGIGKPSPDGIINNYEPMEKFLSLCLFSANLGASIIGACCGSSPLHIKELRKVKYNVK